MAVQLQTLYFSGDKAFGTEINVCRTATHNAITPLLRFSLSFKGAVTHVEILTKASTANEELTSSGKVMGVTEPFFIRLAINLENEQINSVCHIETCKRFRFCAGPASPLADKR